jgi:hypothetical protein
VIAGAFCRHWQHHAAIRRHPISWQTIATRDTPNPTVNVFSNIGTGRITTLLIFGIKRTCGKSVKISRRGKGDPTGKS